MKKLVVLAVLFAALFAALIVSAQEGGEISVFWDGHLRAGGSDAESITVPEGVTIVEVQISGEKLDGHPEEGCTDGPDEGRGCDDGQIDEVVVAQCNGSDFLRGDDQGAEAEHWSGMYIVAPIQLHPGTNSCVVYNPAGGNDAGSTNYRISILIRYEYPQTETPQQPTETQAPTQTPVPPTVTTETASAPVLQSEPAAQQQDVVVQPEPTPAPAEEELVLSYSSVAPLRPWDPMFETVGSFIRFDVMVNGNVVPAIRFAPGYEIRQVDPNGEELVFVVQPKCGFYRILIDTEQGDDIALLIDEDAYADVQETMEWTMAAPNRCFYDQVHGTVYAVFGSTVSQLLASAGAETLYGPEGAVAAFSAHYGTTFINEGRIYRAVFNQ